MALWSRILFRQSASPLLPQIRRRAVLMFGDVEDDAFEDIFLLTSKDTAILPRHQSFQNLVPILGFYFRFFDISSHPKEWQQKSSLRNCPGYFWLSSFYVKFAMSRLLTGEVNHQISYFCFRNFWEILLRTFCFLLSFKNRQFLFCKCAPMQCRPTLN